MGSNDIPRLAPLDRGATINLSMEPLRRWLDDPAVNEICVNRPGEVFIERQGHWEMVSLPELDFKWAMATAVATAAFKDDQFSTSKPVLGATLPTGERVQFVGPPATEQGTVSLTLRRPDKSTRSLQSYIESGFFNEIKPLTSELSKVDKELLELRDGGRIADFLKLAISSGKNILTAGATGSGKTSFMKMLVELIDTSERLLTIEDTPELSLARHPNHVHLYYNSEADASAIVNAASLLKSAMRMRPDRILLAELRGGEAYNFVNACLSGHGGSLTSLHAGSPLEARERLVSMILSNPEGAKLPNQVIRSMLDMVIDVVVHIHKDKDKRRITAIEFDPARKLQRSLGSLNQGEGRAHG